jgi:hypothetical protein
MRSPWSWIMAAAAVLLIAVIVVGALFLTGHLSGSTQPEAAATPTPAATLPPTTPTAGSPTAAPTSTPGTSTPAPAPTTSPSAQPSQLSVPSLGITVPLAYEHTQDFSGAGVPAPGWAILASSTPSTWYGITAVGGGPLQPLASTSTAPSGTEVIVWNQFGDEKRWTLDGSVFTLEQNADGSWPGHGAVRGHLYLQIRTGGHAVERVGIP